MSCVAARAEAMRQDTAAAPSSKRRTGRGTRYLHFKGDTLLVHEHRRLSVAVSCLGMVIDDTAATASRRHRAGRGPRCLHFQGDVFFMEGAVVAAVLRLKNIWARTRQILRKAHVALAITNACRTHSTKFRGSRSSSSS